MTIHEATEFIRPGISSTQGVWADIGAGTGVFTKALLHLLEGGKVLAVDKSPHALHSIKAPAHVQLEIIEGDFNHPLSLSWLDGILMANALHYAMDPMAVLQNVLTSLKPGGSFLLIEYDTSVPNDPWVPYPVSLGRFKQLCRAVGLSVPEVIGTRASIYQDGTMYAAVATYDKL